MKTLREAKELLAATTQGTCCMDNGKCALCTQLPFCNAIRGLIDTVETLSTSVVYALLGLTSIDVVPPDQAIDHLKNLYAELSGVPFEPQNACKLIGFKEQEQDEKKEEYVDVVQLLNTLLPEIVYTDFDENNCTCIFVPADQAESVLLQLGCTQEYIKKHTDESGNIDILPTASEYINYFDARTGFAYLYKKCIICGRLISIQEYDDNESFCDACMIQKEAHK